MAAFGTYLLSAYPVQKQEAWEYTSEKTKLPPLLVPLFRCWGDRPKKKKNPMNLMMSLSVLTALLLGRRLHQARLLALLFPSQRSPFSRLEYTRCWLALPGPGASL